MLSLFIYFAFITSFLFLMLLLNILAFSKHFSLSSKFYERIFLFISVGGYIGIGFYFIQESSFTSALTSIYLLCTFITTTLGWAFCRFKIKVQRLAFFSFIISLFFLILAYHYADLSLFIHRFHHFDPEIKVLLVLHIFSSTIAYLFFGIACLASIAYLYQQALLKNKKNFYALRLLPSLFLLEKVRQYMIVSGVILGFLGLFLGINITLATKQDESVFSIRLLLPLVTVSLYAVFLGYSVLQGMASKKIAIWSILGFVFACSALFYEYISLVI